MMHVVHRTYLWDIATPEKICVSEMSWFSMACIERRPTGCWSEP